MMSFINACRMFGQDRFGGRLDQFNRDGFGRMNPGFMWIGLLIAVLIIVGIVLLIRAIVRSSNKSKGNVVSAYPEAKQYFNASVSQAVQILDERLARGEIDTDEYRRRKDELLKP